MTDYSLNDQTIPPNSPVKEFTTSDMHLLAGGTAIEIGHPEILGERALSKYEDHQPLLHTSNKKQSHVSNDSGMDSAILRSVDESHDEAAARISGVTLRPLTPEQQLQKDFGHAADFYKQGSYTKAEQLLSNILDRDTGFHEARLLLARLYAKQKIENRAELVLSNGLLLYPRYIPYVSLYARMLAGQRRDAAAIDALEVSLHAARDDAHYLALLAGLYQRNGNSSAAVDSFKAALQLDPMQGEWWLGFAISSQQSGDALTAEKAFKQALQHDLQVEVRKYAEQRLRQISVSRAAIGKQRDK